MGHLATGIPMISVGGSFQVDDGTNWAMSEQRKDGAVTGKIALVCDDTAHEAATILTKHNFTLIINSVKTRSLLGVIGNDHDSPGVVQHSAGHVATRT
jgi:hypothetical protein